MITLLESKPSPLALLINAPKAVVSHAGGGGVECGMLLAGINPSISLECNPDKPEFSELLLKAHRKTFSGYGIGLCVSLEYWVEHDYPRISDNIDYFHVSPMCSNFSVAKSNKRETYRDTAVARAIAKLLADKHPKFMTLENVPGYTTSESFGIITDALSDLGYQWYPLSVNCAEYGIPQNRKRLFVIAADLSQLSFSGQESFVESFSTKRWADKYQIQRPVSWFEAISDSDNGLDDLPKTELSITQSTALAKADCYAYSNDPRNRYFLLPRVGSGAKRVIPQNQPAPTITASIFIDYRRLNYQTGAGGSRQQVWTVWDSLFRQARTLRIRDFAKIATFPEWYKFPNNDAIAGVIIGYAVPPRMMQIILTELETIRLA